MAKNQMFQENPLALRACIYYEYLNGRSVFDSYRAFCDKLGEDAIGYPEFEKWFFQFSNGKLELEDEKSQEPVAISFDDLPVHIIDNVLDHLSIVDRLILRDVSQGLRALTDNHYPAYEEMTIRLRQNYISCWMATNNTAYYMEYWKFEDGCVIDWNHGERKVRIEGADYITQFMKHFGVVWKNSSHLIDTFCIDTSADLAPVGFEDVEKFYDSLLDALNHVLLHIKNFEIYGFTFTNLSRILTHVAPGVLEYIIIGEPGKRESNKMEMNELMSTKQWRQATRITSDDNVNVSIRDLLHTRVFDAFCEKMSPEEMIRITETLLESPNFQICFIRFPKHYDFRPIKTALASFTDAGADRQNYTISNSNQFLRFYFHRKNVIIIEKLH